jgi:hypothetical protein
MPIISYAVRLNAISMFLERAFNMNLNGLPNPFGANGKECLLKLKMSFSERMPVK